MADGSNEKLANDAGRLSGHSHIRLLILVRGCRVLAALATAVIIMLFSALWVNDTSLSTTVYIPQWIVANISVQVPTLRIGLPLIDERLVWAGEPALRAAEVPCPEVIEARFSVSFFAGEPC
jgi:hypothetical protein